MSRYADYPRWLLLVEGGFLAVSLPVIFYLQLCNSMALHYRAEVDRYDDAAQAISDGWPELRNFDKYHVCVAYRYLAAGDVAAHYHPFDLWWLMRNWNADFLAEQPVCLNPPAPSSTASDKENTHQ